MNKLVFLALVSLSRAGCTVGGVEVEQERASGLAGELLEGHTFGQTFTLQYDGLYRIDLYTATYARENTHPVVFRVRAVPDEKPGSLEKTRFLATEGLVRLQLPASQISNSGPTVITFPPLGRDCRRDALFLHRVPRFRPRRRDHHLPRRGGRLSRWGDVHRRGAQWR